MAEPEAIYEAIETMLHPAESAPRILVTAGGTREPVDPVRYLGNRSSGKMGHAIANEAARRGCQVTLVTSSQLPVDATAKVITVETAEEMLDAVEGVEADIAIMAAAVADFRPAQRADQKVARSAGIESIALEPTPDILASVVSRSDKPFVVGFAAETGGVERAKEKAARKKVDLLVYNNVSEPGSGFGTDTNRVAIIGPKGDTESWPLLPKAQVAARLLDLVLAQYETQR
jgi:phosphopantothenoylcysteine decarboxylase/phosphopantothenate--cysteine ligase